MKLDMRVGFSHGHIVLDGDPAPLPYLLLQNGCIDQDATWQGGRPQPSYIVLDEDPPPLPQNGAEPSPIFNPCLLWPNGWMDQDATWQRDRPQPKRHCVRWGPSSPSPKGGGRAPHFSAHICYGQMAGSIKMPLGREVCVSPSDIVLHGDPAPLSQKGVEPPILGPYLLWPWPNGWMNQDATWYTEVDLSPGHIVLDRDPAPPRKGHSNSPSFRPMSVVATVAHLSYR